MSSLFALLAIILGGMAILFLVVALEVLTYALGEEHKFTKWFRRNIISHEDLEP